MPFEDFKQKLTTSYLTHRVISQEVGSRINIPEAGPAEVLRRHTRPSSMRKEQVFLSQI